MNLRSLVTPILFFLFAFSLSAQQAPSEKKCFVYDGEEEVIYVTIEISGDIIKGKISSQNKNGGDPLFPSSMISNGTFDGIRLKFTSFPSREEINKKGNDRDQERIWILMNDKITIPGIDGGKTFVLNKVGC